MSKSKFNFIYFLFLVSLISCVYSPDDIPEKAIPPLSGNDTIVLFHFQPEKDTIKLSQTSILSYTVSTLEKKLYKVEFYVDDELLDVQEGFGISPYHFEININNINNGNHTLKILIYTSSTGQSLAEQIGATGLQFEVKWPLFVDKTEPRVLQFTSIDTVENGVKLTWEEFDHPSFQSYTLIKTSPTLALNKTLLVTNDPRLNSFTDTEYMPGMSVTYELRLNSNIWSVKRNYSEIPSSPTITFLNNYQVKVSWKPPRNLSFLNCYYVHGSKTTVSIDPTKKIYEPVRSITSNVVFGLSQYFGFLYIPKTVADAYTGNLLRGETYFSLGDRIPLYNKAFTVPNTRVVLLSNKGKLYRYDMSSGIITDSIQFQCEIPNYISVSENGNFFGYSENGYFITRSTQDLSFISSVTSEDYAGLSSIMYMFTVSNNSRLLTVLEINIVSVFDLATGIKIAEKKFDKLSWIIARISPDGNYIISEEYDGRIHIVYYQVIGNQIVEIGRVSDSELTSLPYIDNPFGPDQDVYIIYSGKVEVRNITDFSVKRTIPVKAIRLIDYQNMTAIGTSAGSPGSDLAYIYDLESGMVLKDLLVRNPGAMKFHGNYLVSPTGYKLNLDSIH